MAAPSSGISTDEEWLVHKARNYLKSDLCAAKAWLVTARTIFPRSFAIQFEAYNIEKSGRNTADVAKLLEEMVVNFAQENLLWKEVQTIADALQTDSADPKTQFLKDVFGALPAALQCHMLLRVADSATDVLEQCRLVHLILKWYPKKVPEQGVKMIESLLAVEKRSQPSSPVNSYRKYLVCDILPLVLKNSRSQISHKHIYKWLQKAIEFYVYYVAQPPGGSDVPVSPNSGEMKSPTHKAQVSFSGTKVHIPGLSEKESYLPNPWEKLFQLIDIIGTNLSWNIGDLFEKKGCESQWQHLFSIYESLQQQGDSGGYMRQVLYCTTVLFFHCLHKYASRVSPDELTGNAASTQQPLVLIEGFKSDNSDISEPKPKKAKHDGSRPQITASKSISGANLTIQNFLTALKCWELLHSVDSLTKDFQKLCQYWKTENWPWLLSFEIDVLMYQGCFKEAIVRLQTQQTSTKGLRNELQLACCYFCLGNYSKACEKILNVIGRLTTGVAATAALPSSSGTGRQLQLLSCTENEILPYCIHMLITCFKDKAFKIAMPDDNSLGHLIVLLQYDWPRYESLFGNVMHKLKKNGSFTYNLFFNYVTNIDILEEFAFVKTQEGGRVNLDILPTSSKVIAQSRTVTRGVNKGVKEDFRHTLERQVARSQENVESVIRHFLTEERDSLQHDLLLY